MKKFLILTSALLCLCQLMYAQFLFNGNNPRSVRWMQLKTDNFQVIYPSGHDSLAFQTALRLEQIRPAVGFTAGFQPNESFKKPLPVLLHDFNAYANGFVIWIPRRMELISMPNLYNPMPMTHLDHLVIHESRHVSQMQYINTGWFRPFRYLTGELFSGAAAGLYCGPAFFEGDAVVAETSLTRSGRGRSADFLEYYRVCADEGLQRNYWQWRWGSLKRYTPDHYALGYMTIAGIRTMYDAPDFTARYYQRFRKHFFPFLNFQKTIKEVAGPDSEDKNFRSSFQSISREFRNNWEEERDARAPFMETTPLTRKSAYYTEYKGTVAADGCLYSIKSSTADIRHLVRIRPDGREKRISTFSSMTSKLSYDPVFKRIWWSEYEPDLRWELKSSSSIRFMDAGGRIAQLTSGVRAYNPAPSPDGLAVSATLLPPEGGSALIILSADDASLLYRFQAPDSLQLVESVWAGERLFVSGVTEDGMGIYEAPDFNPILRAGHIKIKQLSARNGEILFCCDLNGVNELYSLNPDNGSTRQLSSTRNGASEFCFIGDTLYCSVPHSNGRMIEKCAESDIPRREADFSTPHRWVIADKLSAQELLPTRDSSITLSNTEPKRYRRGANLIHLHSWLPFYVDYNSIASLSFESMASSAGLGASLFFQNTLGDFSAIAGYHANPANGKWWHSGHLQAKYTGWYPVFELKADLGDRNAYKFDKIKNQYVGRSYDAPYFSASLTASLPLRYSALGLTFGLAPQLTFSASNDLFVNRTPLMRLGGQFRAYLVSPTPQSCTYPKFGAGFVAGYSSRLGLGDTFKSNAYVMVYGYLPGFWKTQGIRLSAITEQKIGDYGVSEPVASTAPRGFTSLYSTVAYIPRQTKFSLDYVIPFGSVDWALGPVAYLRNFEFYVQGDLTHYKGSSIEGVLSSVGGTFNLVLGNLLWIPYDTRIGLCAYYNCGNLISKIPKLGEQKPYYVGFVFSVDI
ncbi:MAG: hypothetical protein J5764_01800 [Bacteroidales bacterium]|nr:hypothetical protein [Bacteroidales bacterium]